MGTREFFENLKRKKKKVIIDDRMALLISPELHQDVKVRCAEIGISMKLFTEIALDNELDRTSK